MATDHHSSQGAQVVHLGVSEISAAVASYVAAVVSSSSINLGIKIC
jgi:Lhr-like helicase